MNVFRVKAKAQFPYSADGIQSRTVVPGEVFDVPPHLLPGLLAQEVVEESGEEITAPGDLLALQAGAVDPHLAVGVTPAVTGTGFSAQATEVKSEHLEPVRRAAEQEPALVAEAVPQPGNPPPTDDRMTPPHPVGTVVDADDLAAREAAVLDVRRGEALAEPRVAEAEEAAEITGEPLEETLAVRPEGGERVVVPAEAGEQAGPAAPGRAEEAAPPEPRQEAPEAEREEASPPAEAGEKAEPAAAEEEEAETQDRSEGGSYETKDEKPAKGRRVKGK
jgi:hypothetical protein